MPRYTRRGQSCIAVTVVHPASITAMANGPARPCKSPRARMPIHAAIACHGMSMRCPNWQVSTTGYRCPQPSLYAAAALGEAAAASPRGTPPSGSPNVCLPSCTAARTVTLLAVLPAGPLAGIVASLIPAHRRQRRSQHSLLLQLAARWLISELNEL